MQKIYVGQKIGSFTITEYFEYYHIYKTILRGLSRSLI